MATLWKSSLAVRPSLNTSKYYRRIGVALAGTAMCVVVFVIYLRACFAELRVKKNLYALMYAKDLSYRSL